MNGNSGTNDAPPGLRLMPTAIVSKIAKQAKVPDVRFWHIPELTARRACLPVTTAKQTRSKVIAAKPCASSRHPQPPATWTFRPASRKQLAILGSESAAPTRR
jgi:hypothetical protein